MKNLSAFAFVLVFLTACAAYTYEATNVDHARAEWLERAKRDF
jgi:outer membrane biogenesis lipoprotein LolB